MKNRSAFIDVTLFFSIKHNLIFPTLLFIMFLFNSSASAQTAAEQLSTLLSSVSEIPVMDAAQLRQFATDFGNAAKDYIEENRRPDIQGYG